MIKVKDKWLRIALIIIPCGLFLYNSWVSDSKTLQANIIYIFTVILVCEASRYVVYQSRKWFSKPFKRLKRLLALIPAGIIFVATCFVLSKLLRNTLAFGESGMQGNQGFIVHIKNDQVELGLIGSSIIYAILSFLLLFGIYELAYHFARLRHTEKERDRLEKEKLQAELQQLKGIINPHFLFNNLNSLSSLISENPTQAEDFLDELTNVFRYLLRNNETELTTLAEELKFIHSYYQLLQTRYGKAISMHIDVSADCHSYLLPPLTLQLLVENAVKHNRIHKEYPLRIELFNDKDHRLVVRNNLSIREHRVESTGIGLRSINSRYQLLNHEAPTIRQDTDFF
ncbi:MAG TPA: histidine kinase, partial [Chitinophagaceae bacterium]|nr:histidine kinase [Chitinophagaceae bacterium]